MAYSMLCGWLLRSPLGCRLREYHRPYYGDDFAQKFPRPFEDEAEVVADGAHNGVDLVAIAALEEVAAKTNLRKS